MKRDVSAPSGFRFRLWFGLLGGALAWLTHLTAAYLIAEFGCVRGWGDVGTPGVSLIAWLQAMLTTATAIAAAVAMLIARQAFRNLSFTKQGVKACFSAERATAWIGFVASGLFVLIILFESIPILFYLTHC